MPASSNSSSLFSGTPIGQILAGQFASNPSYLPCDGGDYLAASYPLLDKTNLVTTGNNAWTARTLPASQIWSSCAFGNGVFVAVSATSGTSAASSTDGQAWTARTIPSGVYTSVIYAAGLFVAVGTSVCATSPDGVTWTSRTIPALAYSSLAFGTGLFVAMVYGTGNYATSPDGITWTTRTAGWPGQARSVTFGNGIFVVAPYSSDSGNTGGLYVYFSGDGITWDYFATLPSAQIMGYTGYFSGKWYLFNSSGGTLFSTADNGASLQAVNLGATYNSTTYFPPLNILNGQMFSGSTSARAFIRSQTDLTSVQQKPLPFALYWGAMAYGNNTYVILQASSGTNAASLSVDTTKFRTPKSTVVLDTDRLYIRAK